MNPGDLFRLLPAIHRVRDAESGGALKALMDTLERQAQAVHANIQLLEDSWFIETCPDWVVPYIGDLVGVGEALARSGLPGLRTLVANTIGFERARGTLATVGHAATAATGWPVLGTDLSARIVRTLDCRWPDAPAPGSIRVVSAGTPAGDVARSRWPGTPRITGTGARVAPSQREPGPCPSAISLDVWRLRGQRIGSAQAHGLGQGRFTIHPFGIDMPLFTAAERLPTSGPAAGASDVPQPLTRMMLAGILGGRGPAPVTVRACVGGSWLAEPLELVVADLGGWAPFRADPVRPAPVRAAPVKAAGPGAGRRTPAGRPQPAQRPVALIDPERGRLSVVDAEGGRYSPFPDVDAVEVDHSYGCVTAIGGGAYGRADRIILPDGGTWVAHVHRDASRLLALDMAQQATPRFPSIQAALEASPQNATDILIEVFDSAIHQLADAVPGDPGRRAVWEIDIRDRHIAIQAADGFRPTLQGDIRAIAPGRLTLSGLWLRGGVTVVGPLQLDLLDCTVWPEDGAAVTVDFPASDYRTCLVYMDRCVTGPLRAAGHLCMVAAFGSIIDGRQGPAIAGLTEDPRAGPVPVLERSTIIGDVWASCAPAGEDRLITGRVRAPGVDRPPPPQVPFRSLRFGDPDYGALADDCPRAISAGARNGDELGAFHGLRQRARADALRRIVDSHLPEGLSAQVHFMS